MLHAGHEAYLRKKKKNEHTISGKLKSIACLKSNNLKEPRLGPRSQQLINCIKANFTGQILTEGIKGYTLKQVPQTVSKVVA